MQLLVTTVNFLQGRHGWDRHARHRQKRRLWVRNTCGEMILLPLLRQCRAFKIVAQINVHGLRHNSAGASWHLLLSSDRGWWKLQRSRHRFEADGSCWRRSSKTSSFGEKSQHYANGRNVECCHFVTQLPENLSLRDCKESRSGIIQTERIYDQNERKLLHNQMRDRNSGTSGHHTYATFTKMWKTYHHRSLQEILCYGERIVKWWHVNSKTFRSVNTPKDHISEAETFKVLLPCKTLLLKFKTPSLP